MDDLVMNVKIFVSYKYLSYIFKSDLIIPIQTGCALSNQKFDNMLRDDKGKNISCLNEKYCELTAQYWVWKNYNLENLDYIGFMHHRRHFLFYNFTEKKSTWLYKSRFKRFKQIDYNYKNNFNNNIILKQIDDNDIILPCGYDAKYFPHGKIRNNYGAIKGQHIENYDLMIDIVLKKYPHFKKAINLFIENNIMYVCNMYIMRKVLFVEYSNFLFSILKELDDLIDSSVYAKEDMRFLGYLGECLLTIFITYKQIHGVKIKEMEISFLENTDIDISQCSFSNSSYKIVLFHKFEAGFYNFALYVCLQSILENLDCEKQYEIIIFVNDFSIIDKDYFSLIKSKYFNINFFYFNIDILLNRYYNKLPCVLSLEQKLDYCKILLPFILHTEQLFIINSNTIINNCFSLIFQKKTHPILAVSNINFSHTFENCIDTSVMFFNCNLIRRIYNFEDIQNTLSIYNKNIFNILFVDLIYYLDFSWNITLDYKIDLRIENYPLFIYN
ncbi:DUF4422 domain-containing protein, partial [Campylobacter jejuni]